MLVARVNGILTIEPAVRMHRLGDVADEVRHDPQRPARAARMSVLETRPGAVEPDLDGFWALRPRSSPTRRRRATTVPLAWSMPSTVSGSSVARRASRRQTHAAAGPAASIASRRIQSCVPNEFGPVLTVRPGKGALRGNQQTDGDE